MLERVASFDEESGQLKYQYQVVGIVSAGIGNLCTETAIGFNSFCLFAGCALPKLPGIYTRVVSYVDWIHETMAQADGDSLINYYDDEGWSRRKR